MSASWKQSPDGLAPAMGLAPATYLHEEQAHDEGAALAVAHLPVHQGVCLQGNGSVRAGLPGPETAGRWTVLLRAGPEGGGGLTFMTLKRTSWPRLSWPLKNSCSG